MTTLTSHASTADRQMLAVTSLFAAAGFICGLAASLAYLYACTEVF